MKTVAAMETVTDAIKTLPVFTESAIYTTEFISVDEPIPDVEISVWHPPTSPIM
jgi:hypothetical protein